MEKNNLAHDATTKPISEHREYLHDKSMTEEREASMDDAVQFAILSEEELAVQKKLVRKIDALIMPLVILVYLMNYIDR